MVKIDNGKFIPVKYSAIIKQANEYITDLGGFEKFAAYGLLINK